jgi:hypothetical protein
MNHALEMGSGAMIYIPSFIRTGSGIQILGGGGVTHTNTKRKGDLIRLLLYFQNEESRQRIESPHQLAQIVLWCAEVLHYESEKLSASVGRYAPEKKGPYLTAFGYRECAERIWSCV